MRLTDEQKRAWFDRYLDLMGELHGEYEGERQTSLEASWINASVLLVQLALNFSPEPEGAVDQVREAVRHLDPN